MRTFALLPVLALAGACSSEPSVSATNASVEDVQKQVAEAGGQTQMRPGRWEGTMTIKNAAPPGMAGAGAGNATQPLKLCVTPDQVKPGSNPFVAQMQQGCKYDHFKMEGGTIAAEMTCERPGLTMKSKIAGVFTADSYKLTSVAEASGEAAGPMSGMKAESTIEARRTGECTGDETKG